MRWREKETRSCVTYIHCIVLRIAVIVGCSINKQLFFLPYMYNNLLKRSNEEGYIYKRHCTMMTGFETGKT